MKLKWRVDPAPTGRYRSFSRRGWPSADYANGECAACIVSVNDVEYTPANAKANDMQLKVKIACWYVCKEDGVLTFKWRNSIAIYNSLAEAKAAASKLLDANKAIRHPDYQ